MLFMKSMFVQKVGWFLISVICFYCVQEEEPSSGSESSESYQPDSDTSSTSSFSEDNDQVVGKNEVTNKSSWKKRAGKAKRDSGDYDRIPSEDEAANSKTEVLVQVGIQ